MRKIIIAFLVIGWCATGIAQTVNEFGISLYPHFSDRRLSYFGNPEQSFLDSIQRNEISRPSYEISVYWQAKGEKVGLYVGLGYLNTGFRTSFDTLENAPAEFPNAFKVRTDHKNINLTLPVEVNFSHKINDYNEFSFGLGFALSYNLTNFENELYYSSKKHIGNVTNEVGTVGYNRFNTAFQSSVGWRHTFKNGLSFHLQPMFRMWLKPTKQVNDFFRNLYSLGIRTSFTFSNN